MSATAAQRQTAHNIWTRLDLFMSETNISEHNYYAVWGLCNAIINTPNRDAMDYTRWSYKLIDLWCAVVCEVAPGFVVSTDVVNEPAGSPVLYSWEESK